MARRNEDNRQVGTRSRRMYERDNGWYFNTREGTVVGPFRDELEAYTQLEVYIRLADSGMLPEDSAATLALLQVRSAG